MMNSRRARPTPSLGRNDNENASAGFADVHHHVRAWARQIREVRPLDAHGQPAAIDEALVAFGARHGHVLARR